jgi:hypothetical protein
MFKIGDKVTYKDINLNHMTGIIVDLEKGKHGGDCHVLWDRDKMITEECQFNLRKI